MIRGILQLINVRNEEEERPALLLLGYGFFMGIFLATYRVVVETLFLNSFGEYLKEAFFISGYLGSCPHGFICCCRKGFLFPGWRFST
jgi:ATP:ADP antiporter, AAA family